MGCFFSGDFLLALKLLKSYDKNMAEVKIVKMKKEDLRKLYQLGKDFWEKDEWLTKDYLKNSFLQPGIKYTAEIDGEIIGGIILIKQDIIENWLRYVIVSKEFRKLGIGTKLLNAVIAKLKPKDSIFVDTGISDKIAINFYLKNGFKKRGKINNFYDKCPAYFFEKSIK